MYKCTECEKEYDIKPEYCEECGNDSFEEIIIKEEIKATEEVKEVPVKKQNNKEEKICVQNSESNKKFDYFSIIYLSVCALLSLFIIFFAWNPKENENEIKSEKVEIKNAKNIPNIDSFWNNKLPDADVQTISNIQKEQPQPVIQKHQEVKVAVVPLRKDTGVKSKVAQVNPVQKSTVKKPVQQKTQAITQTVKQPVPKATNSTTPVWQSIQQKPANQLPSQSVSQPQQTQTVQPAVVKDTAQIQKELNSYKISLRNAIGKKIDFANVIGDGTCSVSFKVDSAGKLINRAFSKQSTNTTLNDAVYKAVMATPSYNPPPSGYKNETLYLKITFYGGNFQISLN